MLSSEKRSKNNPESEDEDFVNFGDEWSKRVGSPTQYGERYILGEIEGWPNLGKGLKFKGDPVNGYYSVKIHKDDIEEFFRRYNQYQEESLKPRRIIRP